MQHTAFVSDQAHRTIHIININTETHIARLELRNMPYDVMLYDESIQKMSPSKSNQNTQLFSPHLKSGFSELDHFPLCKIKFIPFT